MAIAFAAIVVTGTSAPAFADSVRGRQWYLAALSVAKAHDISRGNGETIALVDTGVSAEHRDLAGAVLPGTDFFEYKEGDGTGRGDIEGHGTEMAGIIAARGHGTSGGILGIAPAAKILPVRALSDGFSDSSAWVKAIDFAIDRRADVINLSLGGSDDQALHAAIKRAVAADIVVVAAVGNRGGLGDDYPGKYPEVLTVGAEDENGKLADFSVTGSQVDLVAPGVGIATTSINDSGYVVADGTSEATAMVSGAAALVRARYPKLSAAEVVHRLTATAIDAGAPGRDDSYGFGRLNLVAALTADVAPLPVPSASSVISTPSAAALPDVHRRSWVGPAVLGGVVVLGVLALIIGVVVVLRRRRDLI